MLRKKSTRRRGAPFVLLVYFSATTQLASDVNFDDVEAALSALESQASEQIVVSSPPMVDLVTATPPVSLTEIAPPPDGFDYAQTDTFDSRSASGGVGFLPIMTDQACPQRLGEITEQADTFAAQSTTLEAQALELNARFAALEERNRALEIDQDVTECPADFLAAVEELQSDLARGDLGALVQEAETFSVCAQAGLQDLNDRMVALEASSDPNAANDRLAVGNVLRRWATADVHMSRAVSSFVFFDQRRVRLDTATGQMLRRCEILGGYE